jgi:hypothetical protein
MRSCAREVVQAGRWAKGVARASSARAACAPTFAAGVACAWRRPRSVSPASWATPALATRSASLRRASSGGARALETMRRGATWRTAAAHTKSVGRGGAGHGAQAPAGRARRAHRAHRATCASTPGGASGSYTSRRGWAPAWPCRSSVRPAMAFARGSWCVTEASACAASRCRSGRAAVSRKPGGAGVGTSVGTRLPPPCGRPTFPRRASRRLPHGQTVRRDRVANRRRLPPWSAPAAVLATLALVVGCSAGPTPTGAPTVTPRSKAEPRPLAEPPSLEALEELVRPSCERLTGSDPERVRDCVEHTARQLEPFGRGEAPMLTASSVARCPGLDWEEALACARALPGRASGARCGADLECASGVCELEDDCGRCRSAAPEGARCSDGSWSEHAARCAAGLICRPSASGERRCSKRVAPASASRAPPGGACSAELACHPGYYCSDQGGGVVNPLTAPSGTPGVCVPLSDLGAPCRTVANCAGLLGCDAASMRCVKKAPLGAACESSGDCEGLALCRRDRCTRPEPPNTTCAQPSR